MFGFGKKRMTEEEILQRMEQIDEMGDEEAFAAAQELEKYSPEAAAVTYTQAFFMGNVVEQNFYQAAQYAKQALSKYPDNGLIWYMGGVACDIIDETEDAVNMLAKARTMPGFELVAATSYASACYSYACKMRNVAAGTLRIDVYSEGNKRAGVWYAECVGVYDQVVREDYSEMSDTDWQTYVAGVNMLLAMAYQGALTDLGVSNNSAASYIMASFKALDSKMNKEQNEFWKQYCYGTSAQMDQAGKHLAAETLRTYTCLLEARYEHSGESFYRAQWHNAKVSDLLKTATEDEKEAWNNFCGDLYGEYQEMKRKHGAYAQNRILDGFLPALEASYPQGQAPDPESCDCFMADFHMERKLAQSKQEAKTEKKKGGLFGFFRK
jgi:hypothetical protein